MSFHRMTLFWGVLITFMVYGHAHKDIQDTHHSFPARMFTAPIPPSPFDSRGRYIPSEERPAVRVYSHPQIARSKPWVPPRPATPFPHKLPDTLGADTLENL